ISVDTAEVPEEEEEVAVEASAAEQKAEEDGNDPDAYAAAVRESADAVQGIQITDRDKKDKESLEKLKEYQEMVKNDPEAALDKFGGNFVEEWVEERSVKDQVFARFQRFHLLNKNHVLRYQLGGEARWFCQFRQLTEAPTPCSNCGGKRIFECQVQPMLIAQMQGPLRDRLDFGTICVYTCEESCDADAEAACAYIEEFAYVQPEPVAEWIPK
ncbi:Programmed cell death protein 2-like, partial [Durusdinium trenchii]